MPSLVIQRFGYLSKQELITGYDFNLFLSHGI